MSFPSAFPRFDFERAIFRCSSTHFLEKFAQESGSAAPTLTAEAMHVLLGHEWRGNVRELENLIERVVAFSTGTTVTDTDIRGWLHHAVTPQQSQGIPTDLPEDGLDLEGLINGIEKDLLMKALERSKWVKKKAARLLNSIRGHSAIGWRSML